MTTVSGSDRDFRNKFVMEKLLEFLIAYKAENGGQAPTIRYITDNFRTVIPHEGENTRFILRSVSVTSFWLNKMEQAGMITRVKYQSRSIHITGENMVYENRKEVVHG